MNMEILDKMFPNNSIPEQYWEGCDFILEAMKCEKLGDEDSSTYWERAGFFFLETDMKDWGRHMIEYGQALDRDRIRKSNGNRLRTKSKIIENISQFNKLISGKVNDYG